MPTPDFHEDDYGNDDFDLDLDLFLIRRAMEEDRAQDEMARRRQADQATTNDKEDR